MTLAIVFRELKAGRINLETEFKVSEHAWRTGGALGRIGDVRAAQHARDGERSHPGHHRQSANDAAIILAEGIGGTKTRSPSR